MVAYNKAIAFFNLQTSWSMRFRKSHLATLKNLAFLNGLQRGHHFFKVALDNGGANNFEVVFGIALGRL